jgi:hypothetical protein
MYRPPAEIDAQSPYKRRSLNASTQNARTMPRLPGPSSHASSSVELYRSLLSGLLKFDSVSVYSCGDSDSCCLRYSFHSSESYEIRGVGQNIPL